MPMPENYYTLRVSDDRGERNLGDVAYKDMGMEEGYGQKLALVVFSSKDKADPEDLGKWEEQGVALNRTSREELIDEMARNMPTSVF